MKVVRRFVGIVFGSIGPMGRTQKRFAGSLPALTRIDRVISRRIGEARERSPGEHGMPNGPQGPERARRQTGRRASNRKLEDVPAQ
ncbi:hypothetical protein [Aureimonas sp. N4]|uniref:hypothetical protein n=1 Tax=Aureimonas sp. N4 TaxID=1638165 RepID=UPI0012E3D3A4|nr:hypothetical protein [Aureimonas sp. N4]